MGYIAYIFDLFFKIATTIKIPIPISEKQVFHLSIYSILIGLIVLGLIIWFISKLLNYEINWSFKQLGHAQNNDFRNEKESNQAPNNISNRTRKGDQINKISNSSRIRKGDVRRKELYN